MSLLKAAYLSINQESKENKRRKAVLSESRHIQAHMRLYIRRYPMM